MSSKTLAAYSAAGVIILGAVTGLAWKGNGQTTVAQAQMETARPKPTTAAQPGTFTVKALSSEEKCAAIADPGHPVWKSATAVPVLLNLSPRVYETDRLAGAPPDAQVKCIRASDGTVILLTWSDDTKDQPTTAKPSPAGEGAGVRVQHTQMTNRFPDGAAIMVPQDRNPPANPCLQMGEAGAPVELYFWHSIKGPEVMKASGRGTTERTGKKFPAKAIYAGGRWQISFVLPTLPESAPVAFAVWDGSATQRGGLKFYSLWHSLQ